MRIPGGCDAIGPAGKIVLRDGGVVGYDRVTDPGEAQPEMTSIDAFVDQCVRAGSARAAVRATLSDVADRAARAAARGTERATRGRFE